MRLLLIFVAVFLNAKVITDSIGREVKINDNIKRVVAIGPGALRLVSYVNSQNRVVGIEKREKKYIYARDYILANRWLLKLPVIGMGGVGVRVNLEKILALKPDIIIAGYINKKRANLIQKKLHIPVVVVKYGDLGTFANKELFYSLKILGDIFNTQKRAREVIEYIKNLDIDIKRRKSFINKRVYIGAVAFKGLHGLLSTMPNFPPFLMVGIKPLIKSKIKSQIFISYEEFIKLNPEIVFLDESGLRLIRKWELLKDKKVYGILPYNNYMTNISTAFADTYYIGKVVNPNYKDIDPVKKAREIYKFLVGKDIYDDMANFFGGFKEIK